MFVSILLTLLLACIVCAIVWQILIRIPLPPPFINIAIIALLVLLLLWVLSLFGLFGTPWLIRVD